MLGTQERTLKFGCVMPIGSNCEKINRDQARANKINNETQLLAACADYRSLIVNPANFPVLEAACKLKVP
jgi:hypothetical protein